MTTPEQVPSSSRMDKRDHRIETEKDAGLSAEQGGETLSVDELQQKKEGALRLYQSYLELRKQLMAHPVVYYGQEWLKHVPDPMAARVEHQRLTTLVSEAEEVFVLHLKNIAKSMPDKGYTTAGQVARDIGITGLPNKFDYSHTSEKKLQKREEPSVTDGWHGPIPHGRVLGLSARTPGAFVIETPTGKIDVNPPEVRRAKDL